MFLAQLNCAQQHLGQIQVAIERLLIFTYSCLYARPTKVEISKQLLSNFYLEKVNLLSNTKVNPKNGLAY